MLLKNLFLLIFLLNHFRQVESGVLDHIGPLVQNLVGHITEFLETCNISLHNQKMLVESCERLRNVANFSTIDQRKLAKETTNLGRNFTQCVDALLLEQVKVKIIYNST